MSRAVALVALTTFACLTACEPTTSSTSKPKTTAPTTAKKSLTKKDIESKGYAKATFAGGCFWCMEPPFDAVDGVISTTSGYAGGTEKNPTYKQVASGQTSHAEVVQVVYDPKKVNYDRLLYVFWRNIDPTQVDGQFVDHGRQYRTAIYYHNDAQKKAAEASKAALAGLKKFDKPIVTAIEPLNNSFWPAETYHQDFYKKSPLRYYSYRKGSGRDQFIKKTWGKKTY